MKRTPWFSAQSQPPVNGGPGDKYEVRCLGWNGWDKPERWSRKTIKDCACPHCQWRGLTQPARPAKEK